MTNLIVIIEKHYPIEGRKDFFKYFITKDGVPCEDINKNVMYFDKKSEAEIVRKAIEHTACLNADWMSSDGFEPTKNY